jgi:hypothetical protein
MMTEAVGDSSGNAFWMAKEGALEGGGGDLVEQCLGDEGEGSRQGLGGVDEEDVQVAQLLPDPRHELVDLRQVRGVALPGEGARQLALGGGQAIGVAPGDADDRALLGEQARGGQADATVAPGDEGLATRESSHDGVLSSGSTPSRAARAQGNSGQIPS